MLGLVCLAGLLIQGNDITSTLKLFWSRKLIRYEIPQHETANIMGHYTFRSPISTRGLHLLWNCLSRSYYWSGQTNRPQGHDCRLYDLTRAIPLLQHSLEINQ